MDYIKIEKRFTQYIIDLLGPNSESDKIRQEKFNIIKGLILNTFNGDENLIAQVYCFGSFPLNTYLQDSDLDITVVFLDKEGKVIINNNYEFINRYNVLT